MRKLSVLSAILLFFAIGASAQFTKLGGGITFGTGVYFHDETESDNHKTGNIAITLEGIYEINLPFHIAPSFTLFMPKTTDYNESKNTISAFLFDINGHYVFNSLDRFEFYGLAGLNVTLLKNKWKYDFDDSSDASTETALGLNIGGGAYMKMTEQLDLFGEVKYIASKRDQFLLTAGVLLNIDWLKKNQ
jgi:opacity protein-like surface antigen